MEQMEEEEKIAVFEMLKTMFRFKPEPQERTISNQRSPPCMDEGVGYAIRIQVNLGKLRGVGNPTTY